MAIGTKRTKCRGGSSTAALVVCIGLGCGGAPPHAEATSTDDRAETDEPDHPTSPEDDEPREADDLSAYLQPVREMLDALDRGDTNAVVDAFRPEVRSEVRSRVTGFLSDARFAEEFRKTLQQLIEDGRLIRADAQSARVAVPIRYGPAINLAKHGDRWYVEDTSETTDRDFPGELPEEDVGGDLGSSD